MKLPEAIALKANTRQPDEVYELLVRDLTEFVRSQGNPLDLSVGLCKEIATKMEARYSLESK